MSSNKRDKNWSNIVVTISTAIFAVVSIITVYISVTSWQAQREAARPYFTFKESPTVLLNEKLSFEFKFNNVGAHPASSLSSKTLIFDQRLLEKPILVDDYTVINDIPRDSTASLLLMIDDQDICQKANLNSQFVIINLDYIDPIIGKSYTQTLYLKWTGLIARKPQPFVHVEANEKEAILNYLKSNHFYE